MFDRFTDRAKQAVKSAQKQARELGHHHIGTEHLLLGLIEDTESMGTKALLALDVSLEAVRNRIEEIVGEGAETPVGHIPFTPRAKKALEFGLREALQLGHNYIGTEHLLLALIRENEGIAATVLAENGVDLDAARQQVIHLLAGQPEPLDDPATAVAAALVHNGDEVTYSFFHSWDALMRADGGHEGRTWRGGLFSIRAGTDGLAAARNLAVKGFLAESKAHWLWWIDTDMGFATDTVERLLEAADPVARPIVGALCFANREVDNDGMGGRIALAAPVILEWKHVDDEAGFDTRWNYPPNTVTRCDGVGSACVLIHRSVFERIAETYGPNWYTRTRNPSTNEMISEDLSFCARVMSLDIPVYVHTGVKTTHAKRVWLSEDIYWQQRLLNQAPTLGDGSPIEVPRTWTVTRYAIVPTHNRPARLLALVVSLGRQCDTIVVVDNASSPPVDEDKLRASVPAHCTVEVIRDPQQPPNLARFWNLMFDRCAELAKDDECWDVAVLNDDAVVPAGWFDAVASGLREHPTAVIGHTGDRGVAAPDLLTDFSFERHRRMAPHAFVIRGETGLRADESMAWWYFDDDLSRQAILAGGVLAVPGPVVINAQANSTTVGVLAEQAERDRAAFEAKWSS